MSDLSWISLTPWDTISVRDGRSFDAGSDALATAVMPSPSTTGGVIADAAAGLPERLIGPFPARLHEGGSPRMATPYFTAPATLAIPRDRGGYAVLRPDLDGPVTDLPVAPLRPEVGERTEPAAGYVAGGALQALLLDETDDEDLYDDAGVRVTPESELFHRETHVGLALDGRRAREGFLYAIQHLRPTVRDGNVTWLVGTQWPPPGAPAVDTSVSMGGRGRRVDALTVRLAPHGMPMAPADHPGGRVAVYCATPAWWPDGWSPPIPEGAELVAAAVDRIPVTTRTVTAEGTTHRLLWCARPGSVYHLRFADESAAVHWSRTHHGVSLLGSDPDPTTRRLGTAGFGIVFTGRWRPRREDR